MSAAFRKLLAPALMRIAFGLAVLAFLVRTLIAPGFMPTTGGKLLELSLCLPGTGQHAWLPDASKETRAVDERILVVTLEFPQDDPVPAIECPLCLLLAYPFLPSEPLGALPPTQVALADISPPTKDDLHLDANTGPPVGSRAPPWV